MSARAAAAKVSGAGPPGRGARPPAQARPAPARGAGAAGRAGGPRGLGEAGVPGRCIAPAPAPRAGTRNRSARGAGTGRAAPGAGRVCGALSRPQGGVPAKPRGFGLMSLPVECVPAISPGHREALSSAVGRACFPPRVIYLRRH